MSNARCRAVLRAFPLSLLLLGLAGLQGCANPALREADELLRANQLGQADALLSGALKSAPQDPALRSAQLRVREQRVARWLVQIEGLRAAQRWDEAQALLDQFLQLEPQNPRAQALAVELPRGRRHEQRLQEARQQFRAGRPGMADALLREILAENPLHAGARQLQNQIAQARPLESGAQELGPAFQVPVTLEFRDAPLRQIFEALSRSSQVNFVFDREVRTDARASLFLRNVTLDEAMRVLLSTQQLDRKLLNEHSVLIYPNSQAKQREHQELITRTLYLSNADVKQVQNLVRTIAKVRDLHIDERLNLMVVRDTPEVIRLVEKLIASVDLPEPEVMLDVEVMEVGSDQVEALGLQWPDQVQYGLVGADGKMGGTVLLGQRSEFRGAIANPALVATLRGTAGQVNLLANPKIRVRNREKAKVQIGQKLPIFTTTTNFTGTTSVAASVSYLDVGLKLDVEPTIQLDGDVIIRMGLEVSNVIKEMTGPGGTTAYATGTRNASTTLRLNDGETQVLAGLINDEDRSAAQGVPGLSRLPLLGRLFGVTTDTRNKTEVVLLITPRIVRNVPLPDVRLTQLPAGTDASPGAFSSLLRPATPAPASASAAAPVLSVPTPPAFLPPAAGLATAEAAAASAAQAAPAGEPVLLQLEATPEVVPEGTVSVVLRQGSAMTVRGTLRFDPALLQPVSAQGSAAPGLLAFELAPGAAQALLLRALPAAQGQIVSLHLDGLTASNAQGQVLPVQVEGGRQVRVEAAR
ncbi:general secretion pathway protein GspD [Mitsuaria sp. WAJ17]|uniref:secretin N-terminal domain-containing protein n=1 Tax=Mitsuaria sp. WAJ17 TaxID=2761452 RepID=UPI0016038011|nr:secretin N-terminal domain-containing protein [Mitsuaria sp. WAJ17]MBB2487913.1 general secretion pathway protein GspD [Mitsuaria sp. WAJ17]